LPVFAGRSAVPLRRQELSGHLSHHACSDAPRSHCSVSISALRWGAWASRSTGWAG